jgi:hypothetical protein
LRQFRIVIEGGTDEICDANSRPGIRTFGCGCQNCTECEARRFVAILSAIVGNPIDVATFSYDPGHPAEISDDLLTGMRTATSARAEAASAKL